jgi:ammonium transporter Rh
MDAKAESEEHQQQCIREKAWERHRLGFFIYTAIAEIVIIILYSQLVEYTYIDGDENLATYYPFFQDVNVMIFIGFGFLMSFLHKYGFSSVGLNFVTAAFSVQVALLMTGFWERVYEEYLHPGHGFDHKLPVNVTIMIKALFAAGAVLITMGACLGKTTPLQLIIMATFELFFFALNETIVAYWFRAVDMGGSMVVHTFGAYFGLAVSRTISSTKFTIPENDGEEPKEIVHKKEKSSKQSDMFAMIATLFLWMFWPSFNGALAPADQQQRVAINTFFALSGCCVAAFFTDVLLRPGRKFDMVSIQNATLAGGVAVGSSSDLVIQPWGAVLIGVIAGIVSVVGYTKLQPCLSRCMGLHDTCGVNNLHGIPGIIGGIGGAISAATSSVADGGYASEDQISSVFPARGPCDPLIFENTSRPGYPCDLTAGQQGEMQAAGLAVTIALAIVGGILTGLIIKSPCLQPPGNDTACVCGESLNRKYWHDDKFYWEVPSESEEDEEEAGDLELQDISVKTNVDGASPETE